MLPAAVSACSRRTVPGCEPDHRFRRAHLHLYRSAGSSGGVENPGFRLEASNTVTLQNGTVAVSQEAADITTLIANSSNLTLQDLNLQGAGSTRCLLSGDSGEMVMNRVNATVPPVIWRLWRWYAARTPSRRHGPHAGHPQHRGPHHPRYPRRVWARGRCAHPGKHPPAPDHRRRRLQRRPQRLPGAGLIAVPADGLFPGADLRAGCAALRLPPVDPDREEVQAGMTSDGETLLAAQTEQLLVDMLGSQTPAGVDEETAARVRTPSGSCSPSRWKCGFRGRGSPRRTKPPHRRSWRTGIP